MGRYFKTHSYQYNKNKLSKIKLELDTYKGTIDLNINLWISLIHYVKYEFHLSFCI